MGIGPRCPAQNRDCLLGVINFATLRLLTQLKISDTEDASS
jgi:hypothetical protein